MPYTPRYQSGPANQLRGPFSLLAEGMELIEVLPGAYLVRIPVAEHLGQVAAGHQERRQRPALATESAFPLTDRLVEITLARCNHAAELYVGEQLQRVRHQLLRREVQTETSEAPLPLPLLCVTALKIRKRQQDADRTRVGQAWIDTGLVFTTRHGTSIEPRNFNRSFNRCIAAAKVPAITVHGTRKTCGSLLAALDVHPRVAMQILRHSKIAVTMEIYSEVPSAAPREDGQARAVA